MRINSSAVVSVIVPVHNERETIARCLRSIRCQTYQDFEVILVDDGSTDTSVETAMPYLSEKDSIIRQRNLGVSAARNLGIENSQGSYVAFLDADDEWDEDFLETVTNLARRYPQAGMFATGYRMRFDAGRVVEITVSEARDHRTVLLTDYFRRSLGGAFIWTGCIMVPRFVFGDYGLFPEGEKQGEDLDMWARIAYQNPIAYDTKILATYHQNLQKKAARFQDLPTYTVVVRTLRNAIAESRKQCQIANGVEAYIKNQIWAGIYFYAGMGNRAGLLRWLEGNSTSAPLTLFEQMAGTLVAWPILRLLVALRRLYFSRFFLGVLGGHRHSHGVITRLKSAH